jgi:protein gp37
LTSIEWTDETWNPVRGCSRVSEGCRNCYAERMAARNLPEMRSPTTGEAFAVRGSDGPHWTGKVELIPSKLDEPLRWKKPRRVFVNSMSDLFHESLSDEAIRAVFSVMARAPQHTFQVLTKRPQKMKTWVDRSIEIGVTWREGCTRRLPSNVWLGVSVEDQKTADERIPLLLQTPAAKRFVSYEPALGPINLAGVRDPERLTTRNGWLALTLCAKGNDLFELPGLDWVIVGAESGPGARPFDSDWARSVRDQCQAAGVAFFYKQDAVRGRKVPTPELDGRRWVEFPA